MVGIHCYLPITVTLKILYHVKKLCTGILSKCAAVLTSKYKNVTCKLFFKEITQNNVIQMMEMRCPEA